MCVHAGTRCRPATPASLGASAAKCPRCGESSDRGPHAQQLREERVFQNPRQIGHARRPASARLEADDPLDGLQMAETPTLEMVFEIDQLFRQLVKIPVIVRSAVNLRPGGLYAA